MFSWARLIANRVLEGNSEKKHEVETQKGRQQIRKTRAYDHSGQFCKNPWPLKGTSRTRAYSHKLVFDFSWLARENVTSTTASTSFSTCAGGPDSDVWVGMTGESYGHFTRIAGIKGGNLSIIWKNYCHALLIPCTSNTDKLYCWSSSILLP